MFSSPSLVGLGELEVLVVVAALVDVVEGLGVEGALVVVGVFVVEGVVCVVVDVVEGAAVVAGWVGEGVAVVVGSGSSSQSLSSSSSPVDVGAAAPVEVGSSSQSSSSDCVGARTWVEVVDAAVVDTWLAGLQSASRFFARVSVACRTITISAGSRFIVWGDLLTSMGWQQRSKKVVLCCASQSIARYRVWYVWYGYCGRDERAVDCMYEEQLTSR